MHQRALNLIFLCLGSAAAGSAATLTLSLSNSGTQSFLSPFPLIHAQGSSTEPLVSFVGPGSFSYDLTTNAGMPNAQGFSPVTGIIMFDFGGPNSFAGTLTGAAVASPPAIVNGIREVDVTAPFTVTTGTGFFANATGTGVINLAVQRATDTSPTAPFTSTGNVSISGPNIVTPEPTSLALLGSGLAAIYAALRKKTKTPVQ